MNKKGISPLIGTALIIGFTVLLAVVIIEFAPKFIASFSGNPINDDISINNEKIKQTADRIVRNLELQDAFNQTYLKFMDYQIKHNYTLYEQIISLQQRVEILEKKCKDE